MAKTIKVIDLLNKIANGEEVPRKIRYEYEERIYDENDNDYIASGSDNFYLIHDALSSSSGDLMIDRLNDKVEIIEEQQDIDIQEIEEFNDKEISTEERLKIDELIKAVKQLDRNIKDKE